MIIRQLYLRDRAGQVDVIDFEEFYTESRISTGQLVPFRGEVRR